MTSSYLSLKGQNLRVRLPLSVSQCAVLSSHRAFPRARVHMASSRSGIMGLFVAISGDLLRRHPVLGVVSEVCFWVIWAEHLKQIYASFVFKKMLHWDPYKL